MLLRVIAKYLRQGRAISTAPVLFQQRSLIKLKKLQCDFQCDDGRPVFLKGGFCDRVLYITTLVLCGLGLLLALAVIYEHAKPPSWRTVCH